jgi:hypothetical protein
MTLFLKLKEKLWGEDISSITNNALIDLIGLHFGEDFTNVKFRRGGILPHIVPFNYSAIVIGQTINIKRGSEFVLNSSLIMAEELYHIIQWRRLGWSRMPFIYIASHLKNGYGKNRIEVEAKLKARKYAEISKSTRSV